MFHTGNHDTGFHDPWGALKKSDFLELKPSQLHLQKNWLVHVGPQVHSQQIVAWLFFFSHPAENQPERGESSFATTRHSSFNIS